jgi:hypothetical protein
MLGKKGVNHITINSFSYLNFSEDAIIQQGAVEQGQRNLPDATASA